MALTLPSLNATMTTKIPDVVELPDGESQKLLGIAPTIITRDDLTNTTAWLKLIINKDQYLEMTDFKSYDLFNKYFLLSLGLLEFPVQFIGGEPQSGKSLYMAWYTHQVAKLFGKRSTLDWSPPNPEYYRPYNSKIRIEQINTTLGKFKGKETIYAKYIKNLNEELEFLNKNSDFNNPPYFSIFDEDYTRKINDEFNRLARMEKETGMPTPSGEFGKFVVFNTAFGLDEADNFEKSSRTNFTKLMAMIGRRRRHIFCCMSFVMIDLNRFDLLLSGLCTHKVNCIWQGHYANTCSILIEDVRRGGSGIKKWLFLRPKDWLHLWHSHNISQLIHNVDISFGKPKKKKILTEEDN